MKRTLLITALFLGFSVIGFSQTTQEASEGIITDKIIMGGASGQETMRYRIQDRQTGQVFESLPTQAQIAISTPGKLYFSSDGHIGMGGLDIFKPESYGNQGKLELDIEREPNTKIDIDIEREPHTLVANVDDINDKF